MELYTQLSTQLYTTRHSKTLLDMHSHTETIFNITLVHYKTINSPQNTTQNSTLN